MSTYSPWINPCIITSIISKLIRFNLFVECPMLTLYLKLLTFFKKFAQILDKLYDDAYTHRNTGFPKSKLYHKLLNE